MKDFVTPSEEIIKETLNLKLNEVQGPQRHTEAEWIHFTKRHSLNAQADGAFIPKTMESHVCSERPFADVTEIHEHIGHGLFYQHGFLGKLLREKEKELETMQEEEQKKAEQQLRHIKQERDPYIEGFALWIERFLLQRLNERSYWERRFISLSDTEKEQFTLIENEEQDVGDYGVLYGIGIPKLYTPKEIQAIVRSYFKQDFSKIELVILFGSQKPMSDIDLMVIGKDLKKAEVYKYWLDMYVRSTELFASYMKSFDILTLSAIANGIPIIGSLETLQVLRQQIQTQPITKAAIRYNEGRAIEATENIARGEVYNLRGAFRTIVSSRLQAQALKRSNPYTRIEDIAATYPLEEHITQLMEEYTHGK